MSLYSAIDRRINADKWFRSLSHEAQLVWFRLLTGPHVTPVAGLWPATEEQLARAFGFTIPAFRRVFLELSTTDGRPNRKVLADWDAGVIWLPNALHVPANQPKNENSLRGWVKHLELVPECGLRDEALAAFSAWVDSNPQRFPAGLPEGFPQPFGQPLAKRFGQPLTQPSPCVRAPAQEQEQEPEQEQEQDGRQRPSNLDDALRLPISERAKLCVDDPGRAEWIEPGAWPEVRAVAEALAESLGQPCVLGGWRDRGVQAVVALFAAGLTPEQAVAAARAAKADPWWREGRRGLSSLTLEVARRALGSHPDTPGDPARAAAEAFVRDQAKRRGETLPPDEFERRVLHELDPATHAARRAVALQLARETAVGAPDVATARAQAAQVPRLLEGVG